MNAEFVRGQEVDRLSRDKISGSRLKNVTLVCQPGAVPLDWETFIASTPPFSIALDGRVKSPPRFDNTGPRLNMDHHDGVNRLATRATCDQVRMSIRQGMFKGFNVNGEPTARVYVNDCDEDVCLSWFLLKYGKLIQNTLEPINPRLNKLISVTDSLDTTAGLCPMPADRSFQEELAWIYAPYRKFRMSGDIDRKKDPESYVQVIEEVEERIIDYLVGEGGRIPLDARYERIGGNEMWALVKEIGAQARVGMLADGIKAFVSVRLREDGVSTVVLGRLSELVPFDIPLMYHKLNQAEPEITPGDRWGGSTIIGGSPRLNGTKLSLEEIEGKVDTIVDNQN